MKRLSFIIAALLTCGMMQAQVTSDFENGTESYEGNPIQELTADCQENHVVLMWNYPSESALEHEAILTWSNGESYTEMAYTGERDYVAHRYDSLDLMHFDGWIIKQISMIPIVPENTYTVDVWVKNGESYELIHRQEVQNAICGEWNLVDLDKGIIIDNGKEYLIGYSSVGSGYYALSGDLERTVPNKNMLMENGEWSVSPMSLHNWMIRATIVSPDAYLPDLKDASLTGYNVYRDGTFLVNISYPFQTYYMDELYDGEQNTEYCVTAVYGDEESAAECVSAAYSSLLENKETASIMLSPNPTNDFVRVYGIDVSEVQVFNGLGQLVKTVQGTNKISVAGLPEGVYVLRIRDAEGKSHVERVAVKK